MILHGDCLDLLPTIEPESVDAVVTDPPYGLSFMGRDWDHAVPGVPFWEAIRGTMKPGAHLLAFGGTRQFHRLAVAIEDAGFALKDTLMWLHGQGFPKHESLLKPAWEPIILARNPGPGVLQIDACRIEGVVQSAAANTMHYRPGEDVDDGYIKGTGRQYTNAGRWPPNAILDPTAAALLDEMSGERPSRPGGSTSRSRNSAYGMSNRQPPPSAYIAKDDTGGASRFFPVLPIDDPDTTRFLYTPKASRAERNAGLEGMPEREGGGYANGAGMPGRTLIDGEWVQTGTWQEPNRKPRANHHPTVKPIALMRWLVRLVTPPGGVVLDPFMGSGTTGIASHLEGMQFIGIEREAEYVEIAERRIAHWRRQSVLPLGDIA